MSVIEVKNLKKYFQVHEKEPGIFGSIKSLFKRKYNDFPLDGTPRRMTKYCIVKNIISFLTSLKS
ncbi:MAG: hypothetical protein ACOZBZ_01715 [Patescibacteria group bacterium]